MNLADELEELSGYDGRGPKIQQIIDGKLNPVDGKPGLDEHERLQLHELIMNKRYSVANIALILDRRGFPIGESSIRRYRKKYST